MEGGKEIVIEPDELQILLNLYGGDFTLSYPLYQHFDILKATGKENGYGLKLLSERDSYRDKAQDFGKYSGEMPSYYDLKDCLLSSGVINLTLSD